MIDFYNHVISGTPDFLKNPVKMVSIKDSDYLTKDNTFRILFGMFAFITYVCGTSYTKLKFLSYGK